MGKPTHPPIPTQHTVCECVFVSVAAKGVDGSVGSY